MSFAVKVLFWISLFGVLYPYAVYPALVGLVWLIRRRPPRRGEYVPTVTVVVPARNEEDVIERRIANLRGLDYPREKVQIVVVSDGSTDGTDDAARALADRGVAEFIALGERRGKTAAQNAALGQARGDIVVFTDASTVMAPDALGKIVRPFADPNVGCVGGIVRLTTTGDFAGKQRFEAYVRFEQALRRMEGEIWTTTGLNGCLYAMRRELLRPLDEKRHVDDLANGLRTAMAGKRVVYEPGAVCAESIEVESRAGFRRRVRTALGGLTTIFSMGRAWCSPRHPFLFVQTVSHRLARYAVVPLLVVCVASNAALLNQGVVYQAAFFAQVLAWLAVALGGLRQLWRALPVPSACLAGYGFLQQHVAAALALAKFFFTRGKATQWEKE